MSRSGQWQRVSRAHPCPICRKPDWCAVSADGRIARCQRVEQGAYKAGTDKNGATYYLHRLADDSRPTVELSSHRSGLEAKSAAPEILHKVYSVLLSQLVLSETHRAALRQRGMEDSEIDRRGYCSLPIQGRAEVARDLGERFGIKAVLSVPGFVVKEKHGREYLTLVGAAGLLIPVRDSVGQIVALKVRRDGSKEKLEATGWQRYSYLSSVKCGGPGPGAPLHFPLGIQIAQTIRLTEGELKADVAYLKSSVHTISVPGIGSWQRGLFAAQQHSAATIRLAFDSDAAANANVARYLVACADAIQEKGLTLELERWPAEYKGIDDALAAGVAIEVLTGDAARQHIAEALTQATASEPLPPPDPLSRLDTVMAKGGAEVLFRDTELLKALARLAEDKPDEFGCQRAKLKRHGVSLRDLDRALATHRQALRAERPPLLSAGEYKVSGGRIVHVRPTKEGLFVEAPLCNFAARIVEQVTVDDGAEKSMRLAVEGALQDGTPLSRVEVPAEKFGYMEWVIPKWGTHAVVNAGVSTKDHLRCAMQSLSGDVPRRIIYGHLGWRKIGEHWVYLHAGGAIGPDGPVDGVEVAPPEALARYVLPAPAAGEELRRAVRASLALLGLAPDGIAFPLLAATYRAVLGGADFAVHLMGQTGVFKSEMAALFQQHFGAAMDARHLPGSWASTGNALESTAFACKDALLTVDDFAPQGGPGDVARLHREAERLLRAQGNAAGRQRMRADGTLRPAKPPRGLILSTGEDVPRGQSLRARLFAVEVGRGDIDACKLTAAQGDAANGLYAVAMGGFVRWLSPQYEGIRGRLSAERAEMRDRATEGGRHARTPGIVADLLLGLRYLLDFAAESGAIDAARRRQLWERGWAALREAGAAQAQHIESAEPTGHFLRLLSAALASGRAHLAAPDGGYPETPGAWGWRRDEGRNSPDWRPQGKRMGWIDGDAVLLEPEASYATAQGMAGEQGESLTVSAQTLRRRLRERGLLASTDAKRETLTIRRVVEGASKSVLHLNSSSLCAKPDKPDIDGENAEKMSGSECRVACRETPNPTPNPTTDPTANVEGNRQNVGFVGLEMDGDTPTAENNYGDHFAPGETHESTRTPFDRGSEGDALPVRPSPPIEPRRRCKADRAPDLFANGEGRDNE